MYCKELNKNFDTEKELFDELIKNKNTIINFKKSQILKSADKGLSITAKPLLKSNNATKNLNLDDDYYFIAVNSTNILDSHNDLHVKGIWNKTIKEQQGKVYLVADHKLELDKVLAKKEDVELKLIDVPFSAIGKSYEGETQVLVYKIKKDKLKNETIKEWLDSGDSIEASVRMQYVKIKFCLNSDDDDHKEYKKNYLTYSPLIANKNDFENEIKYFWAVTEAKNVMESSLVLFGSNSSTGVIQQENKTIEPSEDTHEKSEAEKSLQDRKQFLLTI